MPNMHFLLTGLFIIAVIVSGHFKIAVMVNFFI